MQVLQQISVKKNRTINNMKCKSIHKNLLFYLEGNMMEEKRREIAEHLQHCEACRNFEHELELTLGIIDSEKNMPVNPFFYTRLKAKLENQSAPSFSQQRNFVLRFIQPAVFSLLMLIGIYAGIKIGQPASKKQYTEILMQNQEIPYLNEMGNELIETSLME